MSYKPRKLYRAGAFSKPRSLYGSGYLTSTNLNRLFLPHPDGEEEIAATVLTQHQKQTGENHIQSEDDVRALFPRYKDQIFYELQKKETHAFRDKDTVSVDWLDLCIRFYIKIQGVDGIRTSMIITESMLKLWNMDRKTLMELAKENTPKLHPVSVKGLFEYASNAAGVGYNQEGDHANIQIMTNADKTKGAAVILYPGVLRSVSDQFGTDLILLPSSIHEFLAIPTNMEEMTEEDLWHMARIVAMVNQVAVEPADLLSGSVYAYVRETGEVGILRKEENE